MSDIAIRVENLSKRYLLGHQATAPKGEATLRDNLVGAARGLLRRTKDMARGGALVAGDSVEEFWALKDVSFEVNRGDVVGIIGRNGAGKSTLLKILSRITEPTAGRITINGRVSSLLEVGTGFHPELSGRENIFLNGAILGMSRKEIQAKFDEIVDFAEVEKFLDTPVKRYSSGMYVRLAFAVAAHLEPEILIVDEVLAVGDVQFQKKCLGKMQSVAVEGRTVLFVSHNMGAVEQLTSNALMLRQGRLIASGPSAQIVLRYLESAAPSGGSYDVRNKERKYEGTGQAQFEYLSFENKEGIFDSHQPIVIHAMIFSNCSMNAARIGFTVYSADGTAVGSGFSGQNLSLIAGQRHRVNLNVENLRLAPGNYHFGISIGAGNNFVGRTDYDIVTDILNFSIRPLSTDDGTIAEWQRGWGNIIIGNCSAQAIPL